MSLSVRNLTKRYGSRVTALDSVSFDVHEGQIVGLIGANGAGKTTTIKICTKFVDQYEGAVDLNGKPAADYKLKDYPISYIPDEPVFYEFMTLGEHLSFVESLYSEKDRFFCKEELIERFELSSHLSKAPGKLSKGTKQKMMISMALLRGQELLIADEPFTGLDPHQIREFKNMLCELRDRGVAVMLSTHLLNMVDSYCDEFVVLDKGRVIAAGSKEDIAKRFGSSHGFESMEDMYLGLTASPGGKDEIPAC
ncbi:ABC transporter ATP-binding protein [Paraeggerthella hongkongensis]|nr:ABC transporter ATP-binding protein [Paraeggerthella hongkongensis]